MPFRFSEMASRSLAPEARSIVDLRNAPVRGRRTQFRLAQQNMLAYTFDAAIPGWSAAGMNSMAFRDVAMQAIENAQLEGAALYGSDFDVAGNAIAKVTGDVYEVITSSVLWNAAAHWNRLMRGDPWVASPRYARPAIERSPARQVAVLNLPRRYDWVRLLEPESRGRITEIRTSLSQRNLAMPTSTPDIAIVVLPESEWESDLWVTPVENLGLANQRTLGGAYARLQDAVEPGEIVLAIALKVSLRSDRLYQPLYEANVMQYLLEGELGAPKVEFEVHALSAEGTGAVSIYEAASLHSAGTQDAHRAIRDLYLPQNATQLVQRFIAFLTTRMDLIDPQPWDAQASIEARLT